MQIHPKLPLVVHLRQTNHTGVPLLDNSSPQKFLCGEKFQSGRSLILHNNPICWWIWKAIPPATGNQLIAGSTQLTQNLHTSTYISTETYKQNNDHINVTPLQQSTPCPCRCRQQCTLTILYITLVITTLCACYKFILCCKSMVAILGLLPEKGARSQ